MDATSLLAVMRKSVKPSLRNWFSGGITGKKIVITGDSTISNATKLWSEINGFYTKGDEGLYGVGSVLNYGNNGASIAAALSNSCTYGISACIAAAADLYVICYGINDVRLGACDTTTLVDRLVSFVSQIATALPNANFVLMMPNSMLSDDPGSTGWVNPLASAQAYTNILRDAYRRLKKRWRNCVMVDMQTLVFGETCVVAANNPYMTDILHPNDAGNTLRAAKLIDAIGAPAVFNPTLAASARASNYAQDYTVYYKAVEDANYYDLIAYGRWIAQGSGYIVFSWPNTSKGVISRTDILKFGKETPISIPMTTQFVDSGANTMLSTMGAGVPSPTIDGGMVRVYRHKFAGSQVAQTYHTNTAAYPYRRPGYVQAAGSGYIDINAYPDAIAANLWTAVAGTDKIVFEGDTEVTAFTTAPSGNLRRILKSGDWSALVGKRCCVFGNHAYE